MTGIESARWLIEKLLTERAAACDQIEIRVCENQADVMVVVYDDTGDDFGVLLEGAAQVEGFDPTEMARLLWPQPADQVLH